MQSANAPVTTGFALTCVILFVLLAVTGLSEQVFVAAGFIPARLGSELIAPPGSLVPALLTPLTASLLHVDVLHLVINCVILLFIGRQIEPALGRMPMIVLFVIGAYAAAAASWLADPDSQTIHIGASGVTSALLAVFALIFNRQQVRPIGPIPGPWVRALWLAAAWIGLQLLIGFAGQVAPDTRYIGVGIWAHIGGFLAGLLLARPLLRWRFGGR